MIIVLVSGPDKERFKEFESQMPDFAVYFRYIERFEKVTFRSIRKKAEARLIRRGVAKFERQKGSLLICLTHSFLDFLLNETSLIKLIWTFVFSPRK